MTPQLAITHAGGPLAEALLEQLQESGIAPDSLVLLDTEERAGQRIAYGGTHLNTQVQHGFDYENLAGVLMLEADAELAGLLQHADCPVVSHLELSTQAVLYRPGFEEQLPARGFVKLPEADLATVLPALQAIDARAGLETVMLVSVLSAMHLGQAGVDDLAAQTIALLNSRDIQSGVFPQPLAFNLIPLVGAGTDELEHLIERPGIRLGRQQLLAPAFHGLAVSLSLELDRPFVTEELVEGLREAGYRFSDQAVSPRSHCLQGGEAWISPLERPEGDPVRLQFWLVADSVRNGLVKIYLAAAEFLLKSVL